MARGLKFCIYEVDGLYYLCVKKKGADQLRGYREVDLRLCFRITQKSGFLMTWLISKLSYPRPGGKSLNKVKWFSKGTEVLIVPILACCLLFFFHKVILPNVIVGSY